MRFPPEFIERLRDFAPISTVIGKRISLRKHGKEFQACCPFHKEKTPSFTVNDDKGFYHCFGCAAHGDVIGFVMQHEGLTYPEAVERVAREVGLALPEVTPKMIAREREVHSLEEVMNLATRWFIEQLKTSAGKEARDYLDSRGLSAQTIKEFGLGFAPNQRGALKAHLSQAGIPESRQIEAGLLAKADDGMTYDRFRGRLMFPIQNARGKVIAFGGRILPSAQTERTAKYLNSPETPLFKKGENLFAYHRARQAAHDKGTLLVAEGYMDVIALHAAGFTHAVAPLGTAITESQLQLLWRNTPEPILCLDGDAAGQRAMMRAAELALPLVKAGFGLRFAYLPAGEDPDSLIKNKGIAAMQTVLGNPVMLSQALWERALARLGADTPERKAALERHLNEQADKVGDPLMSQHLKHYFRDQLFAYARNNRKKEQIEAHVALRALPEVGDWERHLRPVEDQLVAIILCQPSLLATPSVEEQFQNLEFSQSVLDKIRANILEIQASLPSPGRDSLCAALAERGLGEKVHSLLQSEKAVLSMSLRNQILADASVAERAFAKAYVAYELARTEQDILQASALYQRDMTETNQTRLYELKQYKHQLEVSRYSVMHDEQYS